jgi:F-type H+-transporting ATPase subunit b
MARMTNSLVLALLPAAGVVIPAAAQEAGGEAGPLSVDGGLVIWTLVVFGLLLFVLRRSAWPVLLAAVRERERRLEEQIVQAQRDRAEAAALLEEHKRLLATARAEAQDILGKAKAVAEHERATLLGKAREEYEAMLARARKDIEEEKAKAILELRREAVDLSIAAASKLIDARLDSEANRRLVSEYLATLARQP